MNKLQKIIMIVWLIVVSFPSLAFDALDGDATLSPPQVLISLQKDFDVIGEYVTLGHIFDGVGLKALNKVMSSPKAGHEVTLNASELLKIARANQINWQPKSGDEKITISRKGQEISIEEIKEKVKEALVDKGLEENNEITFLAKKMEFFVPFGKEYFLRADNVSYNPRNGQFVVSLFLDVEGEEKNFGRLTGKTFEVVSVPLLNREMKIGEIITEEDLEFEKVRADTVRSRDIVDAGKIVGRTVKKNLRAGELISKDDIAENYAVVKGKIVTVQLKSRNMSLTSQAKALENGIEGDAVKVMNPSSKQVFSAVVSGANLVTVTQTQAKM